MQHLSFFESKSAIAHSQALLKSAGITPGKDANFPQRFLRAAGLCADKAFILTDQFNRGELPDPLNIGEQRSRQLITVLRKHYLYGRLKPKWAGKS